MILFDPQPEFVEHDAFLHALLGVAVLGEKFEALLDPAISGDSETANLTATEGHCGIENDEFILAFLGLVALNEKLRRVLDEWLQDSSSHRNAIFPEELGFEEIEDLLR